MPPIISSTPTELPSLRTPAPSSKDYVLLPAGSTDRCPDGLDIPMDECLDAGLAMMEKSYIYNPDNLYVSDFPDSPCGCYMLPHVGESMLITYDRGTFGCARGFGVQGSSMCKVCSFCC